MGFVDLGFEVVQNAKDRAHSLTQSLQRPLSLRGLGFGVSGDVFKDEGRETEEEEVGLGQVPISHVCIALSQWVSIGGVISMRGKDEKGTYLTQESVCGAKPVLEGDVGFVGEVVGFIGDLLDAQGTVGEGPRSIHLVRLRSCNSELSSDSELEAARLS